MHPEIHGALVGGALGGLVVLVGVGLTEWFARAGSRRALLEDAFQRLAMVVPHVTAPLSEVWQGERPTAGLGTQWWARREEALQLLGVIRVNARWLRGARAIRSAAVDFGAKLSAAELNWLEGKWMLSYDDYLEVAPGALYALVVKTDLPTADELLRDYSEALRRRSPGRPPGL